ncbi:hypothetical protein NDU88_002784 [Pleurodeles waltl]|uniref:Uncharacterized protein n=1 Tax=Pleurodeles waltl TaxID=8319 RepID=A0AAV7WSP2_PLEWA|nr:hypothetical protein NDU88_002784 [Pleurodeles waltl]
MWPSRLQQGEAEASRPNPMKGPRTVGEAEAHDRENWEELEQDLTKEEVGDAIRELRRGKVTDPNGLPAELYKCMLKGVAEHMTEMFRDGRMKVTLPDDQRMATVVVVLKLGKNPKDCSSY